jgi:hypothetical protein
MLISVEETSKDQLQLRQENVFDSPVSRHIFFCYEILDQNRPVCWNIVVKKKPAVGSPFFGAFPSDCIPKGTNDVSVLIRSFTYRDEVIIEMPWQSKQNFQRNISFTHIDSKLFLRG